MGLPPFSATTTGSRGGWAKILESTSEGDIAEVPGGNGTLLYNLRFDSSSMQCGKYKHCRVSSVSHDGGETWSDIRTESGLPDPGCKGGIAEVMKTEGGAWICAGIRQRQVRRRQIQRDGARQPRRRCDVAGRNSPSSSGRKLRGMLTSSRPARG